MGVPYGKRGAAENTCMLLFFGWEILLLKFICDLQTIFFMTF
jgi:hypothetical protein